MEQLNFALTTFTSFLAIMNPLANAPVFVGLTKGKSTAERREISKSAITTAFLIGLLFMLVGNYIFTLFGLTVAAFKIAGGILISYVGFDMLQSKRSDIQSITGDHAHSDSVAVSPLAIPILAGPGTIVTAMDASSQAAIIGVVIVVVCFLLALILNYLAFVYSDKLMRVVSDDANEVIGKLMGLILAIVGVNMVIEGIKLGFGLD